MWLGIRSVATTRIESNLRDTVDWGRMWLLISMLEKLNSFHLIALITLVLLLWKWMGLFLRKNYLLRCWGWLSLLNWIGALTLSLLLKLPPRKLESWFVLWSFFLLGSLCISINLPYSHAWSTVAVLKIMVSQRSLTVVKAFMTAKNLCWTVTMTTITEI